MSAEAYYEARGEDVFAVLPACGHEHKVGWFYESGDKTRPNPGAAARHVQKKKRLGERPTHCETCNPTFVGRQRNGGFPSRQSYFLPTVI